MPGAAHPPYVHVRDPAGVGAAVEPLLPVARVRSPVVHRVLDVALGPGEAQVPQGPHEGGVVGVRQVAHPHLQVDDVLGEQTGHARRADVVDPDRPLAEGALEALGQPSRLRRPRPVVPDQGRHLRPRGAAPAEDVVVERHQPVAPQRVDLGEELRRGALVVQPHVGRGPALVVVRLCRDPRPRVGLGQPARGHQAGHPGRLVGVDHDDEVVGRHRGASRPAAARRARRPRRRVPARRAPRSGRARAGG